MAAPIIIVGASHAGAQLADALRHQGWEGGILMIGEEPEPPYQRPPLSKDFLAGAMDEDRLPIRGDGYFAENEIELLIGHRVTAIDRAAKTVGTNDGNHHPYSALALTTGARARRLGVPGENLRGVCVLRTVADVRQIRILLMEAEAMVVVGGGFIGLECAAVARGLGHAVTVLEARERLMPRVLPPLLSEFYARLHHDHGVRIVCNETVRSIRGDGGRAVGVECAGGRYYPADLVVIGVGVVPNEELARGCGLACENGILVDERARTSDPDVVAAGDCANHPNRYFGRRVRLESVQNAHDQARTAAATLAGRDQPYDLVPWFWSDQYHVKLQMAGRSEGHDREVVRGDPAAHKFSVFYFARERLIGADSVSSPLDHMAARKLIAAGTRLTPEQAADPGCNLRALA